MNANGPEAIIIGAGIVDIPLAPVDAGVFDVPSYPLARIPMLLGGDALNEALALARLGHRPALVSKVGEDAAGDVIVSALGQAGVDTSCVARERGLDTGINIVLVRPDGERSFITSSSGSLRRLALADILPALDAPSLAKAKIACLASLFVSADLSIDDTAELFGRFKAKGLTLCADTTRPKHGETLSDAVPMLSRLDYFFPNRAEGAWLTGQSEPDAIADALLDAGVGCVALKLGGEGCLIKRRDARYHVPACAGAKCVDTTGAGDTFAAAFIAALLEGRTLRDCGRWANAAASLCVESVGANSGAWTRADVERRFESLA